MAAPSTAYSGQKLPFHQFGVVKDDTYLALKLPEYSNNVKNVFHVSVLLTVQKDNNLGFLGAVPYNGNDLNYRLHNPARFSKGRLKNSQTNQQYIILNDAGLNTMAYCGFSTGNPITRFANRFKFDMVYESAWYDDTYGIGYQYSVNNGPWQDVNLNNSYPARGNANGRYTMSSSAQFNDLVRVRPTTINPEGKFIGNETAFYALDQINEIGCVKRNGFYACDDSGNQNGTMWMLNNEFNRLNTLTQEASTTEIYAYLDNEAAQTIPAGYYYIDDITRIYEVGQNGEFLKYILCSPPPVPKDLEIYVVMWDDIHYGIQVFVQGNFRNFDISISGYLSVYDANGAQQGGEFGDGFFNTYIPAGQGYGTQNMNFSFPNGQPSGWTVRPLLNISPNNLTYNTHNG